MDVATLSTLIGGLGIGSVVTSYLSSGHSWREVRSTVLAALAEVESTRWVGDEDDKWPDFRKAVHELETAALIARLPRNAVTRYLIFAYAARWASDEAFERWGVNEEGDTGPIGHDLGELVRESAATVSLLAWSPWLGRARLLFSRQLNKQRARALASDDEDVTKWLGSAQKSIGTKL